MSIPEQVRSVALRDAFAAPVPGAGMRRFIQLALAALTKVIDVQAC